MTKVKQPPINYGVNDALKKAGFVRLPPWWVTPDQLEVIHRMAHNHEYEVNRIRAEARNSGTNAQAPTPIK